MNPIEIVEQLKRYVVACNKAASCCDDEYVASIREHAVIILSAADLIVQLQSRLLNIARAGEWIEAYSQHQWPLLAQDPKDNNLRPHYDAH